MFIYNECSFGRSFKWQLLQVMEKCLLMFLNTINLYIYIYIYIYIF